MEDGLKAESISQAKVTPWIGASVCKELNSVNNLDELGSRFLPEASKEEGSLAIKSLNRESCHTNLQNRELSSGHCFKPLFVVTCDTVRENESRDLNSFLHSNSQKKKD